MNQTKVLHKERQDKGYISYTAHNDLEMGRAHHTISGSMQKQCRIMAIEDKEFTSWIGKKNLTTQTLQQRAGLYCYNTEGDRNSVVSHAQCRLDVSRLEQNSHMVFDTFRNVGRGLWTLWGITLKVYEYEYGIF